MLSRLIVLISWFTIVPSGFMGKFPRCFRSAQRILWRVYTLFSTLAKSDVFLFMAEFVKTDAVLEFFFESKSDAESYAK